MKHIKLYEQFVNEKSQGLSLGTFNIQKGEEKGICKISGKDAFHQFLKKDFENWAESKGINSYVIDDLIIDALMNQFDYIKYSDGVSIYNRQFKDDMIFFEWEYEIEESVNEVSKSYNIDKTKFINDVISIWDNADSEDDSEIISNFIKDLEKSDYQVFNKNLKKFKPQELDIIIGPENDPSDVIYVFEDGLVDDMTWNKFYKEYGPEVYGDNSIIVVRKTNKIQETASWIADKWYEIISAFNLNEEETSNVVKAFDRMDYDSRDSGEVRNAMSDALDEAGITFSYDKLTSLINSWGLDKMK